MHFKIDDLNSEQRDAVTHTAGPLMILAGAGTGKTRVITYRIGYMLGCGIPGDAIVALSFTNKAAKEMAARTKALVGGRANKVWLGTFHSFCLSLLRRYPVEAGLTPGFGLAGTADQIDLVRKGLEEKNWGGVYQADQLHAQIGVAKNHLLTPDEVRRGGGRALMSFDLAVLAEVFELYERQLRLNRVIDFDDCIYRAVLLLQQHPEVREAVRRRFRYIMVDEYQDTNQAQLAILELLASDSHDVCVVGDDDQSIYSWRGAMYEVLERFEKMFPGTKIIKLEQNYRCSNVILSAANTVIKNNAKRKDKTLWSVSTITNPIVLSACEDETAEANLVAEKCLGLLGAGMTPSDIGVLYRANNQAKAIELALREARISYKTYGGQSFFERKEIKDFICYLRLILKNEDRLALWRVINTPSRGIGIKTLERIEERAKALGISPYAVVSSAEFAGHASVSGFAQLIHQLCTMPLNTGEDFAALGAAVLKLTGLEQDVRLRTQDAGSRDRKVTNLRSLPQWIATLAADLKAEQGTINIEDLLDSLALDTDFKVDKDKNSSTVSLMSIHAAKGLEFPAVFVIGIEEQMLPHRNSMQDPDSICEERRLFYVALTRAKQRLFLSYCLDRNAGYQGTQTRMPSRFLAEVPAASFAANGEESTPLSRQNAELARKNQTLQRLGALRSSLGPVRK